MPHRSHSTRPPLAIAAVATLLAGVLTLLLGESAEAEVARRTGFAGTVLGHDSWFGSYDMAGLGPAWCVDHGIAAPDPALLYRPTGLDDRAPETRRAMAWALGTVGPDPDRVAAAALTLVLHDLAGAVYPGGPLRVDALSPAQLDGFEGLEADVVAKARSLRTEAVARSAHVPPLTLTAEVAPVAARTEGEVRVRLVDATGAAVEGIIVTVTSPGAPLGQPAQAVTGSDGVAEVRFLAAEGTNRFEAAVVVPDLVLSAHAPQHRPAQRVATPRRVELGAEARFDAIPRGRLRVHKDGDAEAWVPVTGARFEVHRGGVDGPVVGTLTADVDGKTPPIEADAGAHTVVEIAAPAGYSTAGPWPVEVRAGEEAVVTVVDRAVPGSIRLVKRDAVTGAPLAGARFALARDADADGSFETALTEVVSGTAPTVIAGLAPGDHRLTEVAAPPGYEAAPAPLTVRVLPGGMVEAVVDDRPLPPAPPTTVPPTTVAPTPVPAATPRQTPSTNTTLPPTTLPPTTLPPTTVPPTTLPPPTTVAPTTVSPTTVPPTTVPPTTVPPTTVPPTTLPPTTLPPTTAPSVAQQASGPVELPRTGAPLGSLALLGLGLVLAGFALVPGAHWSGPHPRRQGGELLV